MSFKDKVVLVTGSSSGIGATIAKHFCKEGANVVLVGRNEARLNKISDICEKIGKKPLVVKADVTKNEDVRRMVDNTIKHFSKLDVLVNNAGIVQFISICDENAMEKYDTVMNTDLRAAVEVTHYCVPHLIKTKGNIINVSSISAFGVLINHNLAYCTAKAALDHFTRCVAYELGPKGVRANCINPGPVKTDYLETVDVNDSYKDEYNAALKAGTTLNKICDPEEIADLVLFLASDKARSVTGSSYVMDNGALLKGRFDLSPSTT